MSGQPEYPGGNFRKYAESVRARLRNGLGVTPEQLGRLHALRDRWDELYQRSTPFASVPGVPGGMSHGAQRPPSREEVEIEFGPAPAPTEDTPAEPRAEPDDKQKRAGRGYDVKIVAPVIDLAVDLKEIPRRAVRERWFHQELVPGATTTLIDHILELMGDKPLSATRRKLWEREARQMADDGTVTLDELTQRLK